MTQTTTRIRDKVRAVRNESGAELSREPAKILALGAVATSLAFAWSGGNEALIAIFGARMIASTHSALLTAAATGLTSFSEQAILGIIASVGLAHIPRTMAAIHAQFYGKNESPADNTSTSDEQIGSRVPFLSHLGALALGSTLSTLIRNRQHARSLAENARNAVIDAAFIGTANFALGAAAAGLADLGLAAGQETITNAAINVASNPLTWLGVFAVYKFGPMAMHATFDAIQAHRGAQTSRVAELRDPNPGKMGLEDASTTF